MPILFSLSHTVCMCMIEFPRYDPKLMIRIRAHSHHTNQMYSICRTHISIYLNDFRMTFTIFNTSQFEYILSIPCKSQTRSQTHTECGKDKLLFSTHRRRFLCKLCAVFFFVLYAAEEDSVTQLRKHLRVQTIDEISKSEYFIFRLLIITII